MGRTAKFKVRVALWSITGVVAIFVIALGAAGLRFTNYRNGYCNISLANNKAEVMYRLGYPMHVLGQPVKMWGGYANPVYATDQSKDPKNAMPKGKTASDFDQWSYTGVPGIGSSGRLDVSFKKSSGQVQQISCLGTSVQSCPPLAGISVGTTEEVLRRTLGNPETQKLDGVTKIVEYKKLGLIFYLAKDNVYNLALLQPTGSKWYAAVIRIKNLLSI